MINRFNQKEKQIILSILFMIAASFSFACGSIITKILGNSLLGDGVNPFQIAHARFFFSFIFLVLLSRFYKTEFKSNLIKIHVLRSCFGLLGISIWFTSILYIPVSDATAINFLNPIFAMIFAVYFLREQIDLIRWSAALISLTGGLILIRPSLDLTLNPIALLCLFGAIIMGLEIICIKFLTGKESIFKILFLNNLIASFVASIFLPLTFKLPSIYELFGLISIALFFLTGQFLFLNSIKRAEASLLMPFFYSTIIFVVFLDLIIFRFIPDLVSFAGASIIILGALIISFRELKIKN